MCVHLQVHTIHTALIFTTSHQRVLMFSICSCIYRYSRMCSEPVLTVRHYICPIYANEATRTVETPLSVMHSSAPPLTMCHFINTGYCFCFVWPSSSLLSSLLLLVRRPQPGALHHVRVQGDGLEQFRPRIQRRYNSDHQ